MTRAAERRAWAAWAWAGGVFVAARVPALRHALPFLGVAAGPLGLVLLAFAAVFSVVALAEAAFAAHRWDSLRALVPRWPRALREPGALLLGLVLAGLFLAAGLFYTARLGVSGDEPHYLLMAQSLWRDGDLDLRNNVANGDWQEYTPRAFEPHWGAPRRDGRPFPSHSPGLPLLLAPFYALAGRTACIVLMGLLAATVALVARALALRLTGDRRAAFFAFAVVAGPPLVYYSFHLYTETPSALALWGAFGLLLGGTSVPAAIGAALLAACLPWLHVKMLGAAAALGFIALVRLRGRRLAAFLLVAGGMALVFLGYYQAVFGQATPLALYGGLPSDLRSSPLRAAAGLLLDRSFGLLPSAPAVLLALPGVIALARRRDALPHLLIAVAVLAPVLSWRMWWGGQCPPSRFLVPLVPFFAVSVAAALSGPLRGVLHWRTALVGVGLAMAVFAISRPEDRLLLNRANRPTRLWAALSGDVPVERYLPSLTRPDPFEERVAIVWGGALVALLLLDRLAQRRDRVDAWFRGLALPVVLLLAIGASVDFWARSGQPRAPMPASDALADPAGARPDPAGPRPDPATPDPGSP